MLGKPLTDDWLEFLPLLTRREKCEQFAVGCYGARQAVKRRRVLGDFASLCVGIRRKLENSIYDFVGKTGVRFHHGLGPLLSNWMRPPTWFVIRGRRAMRAKRGINLPWPPGGSSTGPSFSTTLKAGQRD